ncbi:hypothetical protein BASA62_007323 [Batrachochytrium salamandrivorans]|nr:hypothetical protein BASA62_007323 [Batrachochytrium salamandrivorans]
MLWPLCSELVFASLILCMIFTYQSSFTEKAGESQKNSNFGKGGQNNNVVAIVNVPDTCNVDSANFFTTADGQSGAMNMRRFTSTTTLRS